MTDYSQNTDFSAKDSLPSGDSGKVIKGSEFDAEFAEIQTAITSKANKISGGTTDNLTGQDANGDLQDSGYAVIDDDTMATASASNLSTSEAIKAYIDALGHVTAGTSVSLDPYSTSGTATAAHGLGATPTFVSYYLECKTTDNGYAVGDRIVLDSNSQSTSQGIVVGYNSTNVFLATNDVQAPRSPPKTGGAAADLTAASWKLVAVPYLVD